MITLSDLLVTTPSQKPLESVFLFAHGAGAPMDSDWMNQLTLLLTQEGVTTVRFEFPYMAQRRQTGMKRPPNQTSTLLDCWRETVFLVKAHFPSKKMFIGGKSMGGRMASLTADELQIQGLVCFGFPFHPPGKETDTKRLLPLQKISCPALIVQGERDTMGSKKEVISYNLSKNVQTCFLPSGDHSFKPLKKSSYTLEGHLLTAAQKTAAFIRSKS